MTVPTEDLTQVRTLYPRLEEIGYDRAFSFEAKHDPFIPLAVAGEHTSTHSQGYLNGGGESGERAAREVLAARG